MKKLQAVIVFTISTVLICLGCTEIMLDFELSVEFSKKEDSLLPCGRTDPIFEKPAPILFAHRGGARETAESTKRGFRHAIEVGADVLELDVHALDVDNEKKERDFIVWHGPELSNVRIGFFTDFTDKKTKDKESFPGARTKKENDIRKWNWEDLKGRAWVADPEQWFDSSGNKKPIGEIDLSSVEESDDRLMITLGEFLEEFPDSDLNIELKDSVSRNDLKKFLELIDRNRNHRTILVVSLEPKLIKHFRKLSQDRYPTGRSLLGVIRTWAVDLLDFIYLSDMKKGRALQTSYHRKLTPESLIRNVQERKGAVHVFLTTFTRLIPAIDAQVFRPAKKELFEILDRGVDGVMTDRPERVRALIDDWRRERFAP